MSETAKPATRKIPLLRLPADPGPPPVPKVLVRVAQPTVSTEQTSFQSHDGARVALPTVSISPAAYVAPNQDAPVIEAPDVRTFTHAAKQGDVQLTLADFMPPSEVSNWNQRNTPKTDARLRAVHAVMNANCFQYMAISCTDLAAALEKNAAKVAEILTTTELRELTGIISQNQQRADRLPEDRGVWSSSRGDRHQIKLEDLVDPKEAEHWNAYPTPTTDAAIQVISALMTRPDFEEAGISCRALQQVVFANPKKLYEVMGPAGAEAFRSLLCSQEHPEVTETDLILRVQSPPPALFKGEGEFAGVQVKAESRLQDFHVRRNHSNFWVNASLKHTVSIDIPALPEGHRAVLTHSGSDHPLEGDARGGVHQKAEVWGGHPVVFKILDTNNFEVVRHALPTPDNEHLRITSGRLAYASPPAGMSDDAFEYCRLPKSDEMSEGQHNPVPLGERPQIRLAGGEVGNRIQVIYNGKRLAHDLDRLSRFLRPTNEENGYAAFFGDKGRGRYDIKEGRTPEGKSPNLDHPKYDPDATVDYRVDLHSSNQFHSPDLVPSTAVQSSDYVFGKATHRGLCVMYGSAAPLGEGFMGRGYDANSRLDYWGHVPVRIPFLQQYNWGTGLHEDPPSL